MFKVILKLAGIFLVVAVITYLCAAFHNGSWDQVTWADDSKGLVWLIPFNITGLITVLWMFGVVEL